MWCGGGHCHTGNTSLCAPFDYLEKAHEFLQFSVSKSHIEGLLDQGLLE